MLSRSLGDRSKAATHGIPPAAGELPAAHTPHSGSDDKRVCFFSLFLHVLGSLTFCTWLFPSCASAPQAPQTPPTPRAQSS